MTLPRIFAWQADSSACGWYRCQLPLVEYIRRGGSAEWATIMPGWVPEDADVIIGQRVAGHDATKLWQALCRQGRARMVLELDDDLWNLDPSNAKPYRVFNRELQGNLERNIAAADMVTVTTGHLADVVSRWNPNVAVVPNRIPAWLLEHQRPQREELTIGWAGSSSHAMDWADPAPQIGRFLKRHPTVRAHLMGGMFPSMRTWPHQQVQVTKWVASVAAYYRLLDFDIGLAPLKPHVFNKSKSSVKAAEYFALGIPVVASAAGPYESFVRHGETGFLVKADHEWGTYLRALAADADLRTEMGRNARQLAAQHTVEGNLDSWLPAWGVTALQPVAA